MIESCSHGRAVHLPEEIWIGVHDTEWPIRAFNNAESAADWVGEDVRYRHAYRIDASILAEVVHVPPVAATYRVVPVTTAPD